MKSVKLEFMVGLFVLTGLLALAWLSVKLARMELVGGDHTPIFANFASVSGMKSGAPVEIAGVEVGRVDLITLNTEEFEARVRMQIHANVRIQEDAMASVRTKGLIGDRYIVISPGGAQSTLKANDTLTQTEPAIDFEELLGQMVHGTIQ